MDHLELTLVDANGIEAPAERARFDQTLRMALNELPGVSAKALPLGAAPTDAKGMSPEGMHLLITAAPSATLVAGIVRVLIQHLKNQAGRTLELVIGDKSLTITGNPTTEQREVIAKFVEEISKDGK